LFRDGWLDTGDVGYFAEGELYVTSRAKDIIIRGGQHLHPYELEETVGAFPGIRRGCVAVFAASDPGGGPERVVVIAETRTGDHAERTALRQRIAAQCRAVLGIDADDIVLAPPRTVPKTSSGKVRRAACRKLYEDGRLVQHVRAVPLQVARLWLHGIAGRAAPALRRSREATGAAWLWLVFGMGALAAAAAALLPWGARKRAIRSIARVALRISLLRVVVGGTPPGEAGPFVIACNHASYVDSLLLTAMLPAQARFVAKRELGSCAALRWLLDRLGVHLVEREDLQESVADATRLADAARAGESLVFFPEGTFVRAPGLNAFRMGAFVIAARSGVPVLPVALGGTRSVLRDGSWWPRFEPLRVWFGTPIVPRAGDWAEAVRLRDEARRQIAAACAEPSLPGLLLPGSTA
jgi:1-acyl-sn-glycerol-3-phosphate acyltransferase